MHELFQRLLSSGPVILDGAWGTELQARGLSDGTCPDEWNLTHPERVEEVARSYVDVGSQIVLTNTFRANRLALATYDLSDKTQDINRAGAQISLRASAGRARVFGSIGPSGQMLLMGQVSEADLRVAFREQAKALSDGGVDGLVIETMSDLAEAKIALAAAKETGLPVVCCMVFDSGRAKDRTMMGHTAEQVAQELTAAGADVVGANCGQGIASYAEVCRQLHRATELPIWIKANAGIPEVQQDRIVYGTSAEQFAEHAPELLDAGASFLGGCCGTGPEYIRALKRRIRP